MQDENFDKVAVTTTTTDHKNRNQASTGSNAMTRRKKVESAKEIIKQYKDIFEGELGSLKDEQTLTVDPTVPSNISPSRRVPFALMPKLEIELKGLTDLGIIKPVDEPTDWVSNVVIATKESRDIRLCLDTKHLNRALKREHYPLPVIDDVLPNLAKVKVFTKVDTRNGYLHVKLNDESGKLTTFDTPYGRY